MKYHFFLIFLSSIIIALAACQMEGGNSEYAEVPVKELRDYESLTSERDILLGMPARVKYDHDSQHLFIHDVANWAVIEFNESRNVVQKYGKRGRGPGELQGLDDFFITNEHLFIVDGGQDVIQKYSLEDGQFISSFNYGEYTNEKNNRLVNGRLLPPTPALNNNYNRPFVTLNETILLPSHSYSDFLYEAINWQGEKVADIGEVPKGFTTLADHEEIRSALENKRVPARDSVLAFPANDWSNPNEIYLIYSAIPKITKYSLSGNKIWEKAIPVTPEVDSLMIDISNVVKENGNANATRQPLKKYMAGRNSPEGDIFLNTYTNLNTPGTPRRPMWIHQFDSAGTLIHRYKIISDVDVYFFPGIDFKNRRMVIPSFGDSDIRMYPF